MKFLTWRRSGFSMYRVQYRRWDLSLSCSIIFPRRWDGCCVYLFDKIGLALVNGNKAMDISCSVLKWEEVCGLNRNEI